MMYIGLVSTINGFEQTKNLEIKFLLWIKVVDNAYGEEKTFVQNLFLRLSEKKNDL